MHKFIINGDIVFDRASRSLFVGDDELRLTAKQAELLTLLLKQAGQVVEKAKIEQAVWPESYLEDNTLARTISDLRRALGDDAKDPAIIQTMPRRGYRCIASVSEATPSPSPPRRSRSHSVWLMRVSVISTMLGLVAILVYRAAPWEAPQPTIEATRTLQGISDRLNRLTGEVTLARLHESGQLIFRQTDDEVQRLHIWDRRGEPLRPPLVADKEVDLVPGAWRMDGRAVVYFEVSPVSCRLILLELSGARDTTSTLSRACPPGSITYADFSDVNQHELFLTETDGQRRSLVSLDTTTGDRSIVHVSESMPLMPRVSSENKIAFRYALPNHNRISVIDLSTRATRAFAVDEVFAMNWVATDSIIFSGRHDSQVGLFVLDTVDGAIVRAELGFSARYARTWVDGTETGTIIGEAIADQASVELYGSDASRYAHCVNRERADDVAEYLLGFGPLGSLSTLRVTGDRRQVCVCGQPDGFRCDDTDQVSVTGGWYSSTLRYALATADAEDTLTLVDISGRVRARKQLPFRRIDRAWYAQGDTWWLQRADELYYWVEGFSPEFRLDGLAAGAVDRTSPHWFYAIQERNDRALIRVHGPSTQIEPTAVTDVRLLHFVVAADQVYTLENGSSSNRIIGRNQADATLTFNEVLRRDLGLRSDMAIDAHQGVVAVGHEPTANTRLILARLERADRPIPAPTEVP